MKALILGGGFAGCTTAYLLRREGWDVTLIEKEAHLGGGCRTFWHCGHPFTYGPRLYYGYSERVFNWVNGFVPIRRFPFELRTLPNEPLDSDRRFWTYPPHEDDIPLYPRSAQIQQELAERDNSREPRDFDEYYRQKVGPTLYEMFTDYYSRKMWSIESNKVLDTFKWSAKDKPIESGGREAYKGSFIGYPIPESGYNGYFDAMVDGVSIELDAIANVGPLGFSSDFGIWVNRRFRRGFDIIISTIPIDELAGKPDSLPYAGRDFHLLVLPCREVFPGNVRFCHYAGRDDEWTRVTEFKKITWHESDSTLLVLEKPSKANKLYPMLTKANIAKAAEYQKQLPPNIYSIGRLGKYRYATIEQVIVEAFTCAAMITGKPNEMEGEWRGIGDVSMMKDRKEAA